MVKERRERLEENFIISSYINVHTHINILNIKLNCITHLRLKRAFILIHVNRIIILITRKDFRLDHAAAAAAAKSLQSCPTLCDPIDGNPQGFPVPGILQARTLGVAISFSNA